MGTCNFVQDAVSPKQGQQTSDMSSPPALFLGAGWGGIEVGANVPIAQAVEITYWKICAETAD
jgi:hypothetical protein